MSVLFGIPGFYHRFGYVPAWVDNDYSVETSWWPAVPADRPAVRCAAVQRDDAIALYNSENATRTGTAVRRRIGGATANSLFRSYRWSDADGVLQGYVTFAPHPPGMNVEDHAGDPEQVLRHLLSLARKYECSEIRFPSLHPASPLACMLRRGDCRVVQHYRSNSGPMITVLNLQSTLQKLCEELTGRLARSPLANWSGDLAIRTRREQVMLHIRDRQVLMGDAAAHTPHVVDGGDAVARLLIGSDKPETVCDMGGISCSGDAGELARVLFPEQHPTLAAVDRF